ncbi:hypothetical protein PPL_08795 [Heterostelium album PN500]|uniref:Uncharacterized protein n=1 Tax=Heterostelium pallidum (strain ATCC 26659 / Pp 5 / PN500) TaxID=670386 RepID=D3BJR5_HETP5|nr:hypothetical protein PPL_08795 [Heterostelium album PN500]EFA78145.1 hypothetical protein PPL_08795 [Heterostelium album PN500]|eukprot:XP_020430271.1 hypothetical protein PPL_08795 [Heterostelium album PN500]
MNKITSYKKPTYYNHKDEPSNIQNPSDIKNMMNRRYKILLISMAVTTIPSFFISVVHLVNGLISLFVIALGTIGLFKKSSIILSIFQILTILVWIFTLTVFIFGIIEISNGKDINDKNRLFFNYNQALLIVGTISSSLWLIFGLGAVGLSQEVQRFIKFNTNLCIIEEEPFFHPELSQPLRSATFNTNATNYSNYNTFPSTSYSEPPQQFLTTTHSQTILTAQPYQYSKYQVNYPSSK